MLYFETHGSGKPIILISGFACYSSVWKNYIQPLSQKFQVITVDNRGTGKSQSPPPPYSIEEMAHDVLEVMDHLHLEKATLVGHSMGSCIALKCCALASNRIEKAYLLAAFAQLPTVSKIQMQHTGKSMQAGIPMNFVIEGALPWMYSNETLSAPNQIANIVNDVLNDPLPQTPEGYAGQMAALLSFKFTENLSLPVHIIAGKHDVLSPPYCIEKLKSLIPHAEISWVEKGSHMFAFEHPETVLEKLL